MLKILVEAGARENILDGSSQTALDVAVLNGFSQGVEFLLQNGWLADLENEFANTPLIYATTQNFTTIARRIVQYDISSIYHANERNCSPLLLALEAGYFDLAMFYIKAGGSLLDRSYELNMGVYLTYNHGYIELMEALLVDGANCKLIYYISFENLEKPNHVESMALLASWGVDPAIRRSGCPTSKYFLTKFKLEAIVSECRTFH
nr:ankyrin repeat and KH domain containing protein [Hymenolepis microstoma]